jgi:hypothetical protein
MLVEVVVDVCVEGLGNTHCLLEGWVGLEDVFQQLACGRLTTFCHPVVWDENIAVWSPDTVNKDGLFRHGQMAGRSSSNSGEASKGLRNVVLVGTGLEVRVRQANLCSDGTDPTSIGINDTSTDGDTRGQTKVSGSLLAKSANLVTSSVVLSALRIELAFARRKK